MVNPAAFAPVNLGQAYAQGLQVRQHRENQQDKKRLRELLPVAMGRGGMSEGGALGGGMSQDDAIAQLYAVDPEIAMRLDEHQRAVAKEVTSDLANAVRWADTPDKWQQVQEFYGGKGVNLSQYRFEDRELGLVALGKIGEHLKAEPKPEYRTVEAGGSLIDVSGGNPRVVIAPNDGSQPMGSPVQQAGGDLPRVAGEADYNALRPGQRYVGPDGQVRVKRGGPTPQASGGFPASGY